MIFITLRCLLLHLSIHTFHLTWEGAASMRCMDILLIRTVHARPFVLVLFRCIGEFWRLLSREVVRKSVEHWFTQLCPMRVRTFPVRQSATLFNHCLFPQIHGSGAAITHYSISASYVSHRFHFKNNCGLVPSLELIELLSRCLSNIEVALLRISHAVIAIPRRWLALWEAQLWLWST